VTCINSSFPSVILNSQEVLGSSFKFIKAHRRDGWRPANGGRRTTIGEKIRHLKIDADVRMAYAALQLSSVQCNSPSLSSQLLSSRPSKSMLTLSRGVVTLAMEMKALTSLATTVALTSEEDIHSK
jgi:hypothetical protein